MKSRTNGGQPRETCGRLMFVKAPGWPSQLESFAGPEWTRLRRSFGEFIARRGKAKRGDYSPPMARHMPFGPTLIWLSRWFATSI